MPPGAPKVSVSVLAAGSAAVTLALARFWGANPEYVDRFLILAGAAYAAWSAWPAVRSLPPSPTLLGYLPLLTGAAAFPVGWFLQAQVVPKPVVLWWLAAAWVLTAGGVVLTTAGWKHLRALAFPLGVVLFALPVPTRVHAPLQAVLQSGTTTLAEWALPLLGIPVERQGFVLCLPGGDLGVAEACSGVRSVTALTAIAAFVAWWHGLGPVRGCVLVALSVPVVAAVNAARVVASGVIQERAGADYVRGNWHEALGVLMVLLGLGLIVALAHLMRPRAQAPVPAQSPTAPPGPARFVVPRPATVLLLCSAVATAAAQFLGAGAEGEVLASAPIEQIPHTLGRWRGTDLPVPDDVRSILSADAITRREYNDLGYTVHVWVIYWSSQRMVNGYHHPDVCWQNRGFHQTLRDTVPVPVGGASVPVTLREFARTSAAGRDTDRQLILYWTQEGKRVWDGADEQRAQATGGIGHDWLGERLFRRDRPAVTGRLVVLLGTPLWGTGGTIRTQALDLAGRVAGELYRTCPWADLAAANVPSHTR